MTEPARVASQRDRVATVRRADVDSADRHPATSTAPAVPIPVATLVLTGTDRSAARPGEIRVGAVDDPAEARADRIAGRVLAALRSGRRQPAADGAVPHSGLARRTSHPAGPSTIRRAVVAQLGLTGGGKDTISRLIISGRPPNTYGDSMGDHSTAFTVHVNAVQLAVEGNSLPDAASNLHQLVDEIRRLPGYKLVKDLPDRQSKMWSHALAEVADLRRRLDAAVPDQQYVDTLQRYIAGYLELRELVPLSTINTGTHSKATAGKGKGEAVRAMRAEAGGTPQPIPELRVEVVGSFDAQAAALVCGKNDTDLASIAPGMPTGLDAYDRARLLTRQHLTSIQTAYPGVLAAIAEARPEVKVGETPDKRRRRLQEADQAALEHQVEDLARNHVLVRMAPWLQEEYDRLLALQLSRQDENERIELELVQAGWNESEEDEPAPKKRKRASSATSPVSSKAPAAAKKRKLSDAAEDEQRAKRQKQLDDTDLELNRIAPLIGKALRAKGIGIGKAATTPKVTVGRPSRKAAQQQVYQNQKFAVNTGRIEKKKRDETVYNKVKKREAEQRAASLRAPKVGKIREPLAVQVLLKPDGTIDSIRFAGRTPSPFPGTMGAHTTAWIVHLDRVQRVLRGKTPDAAIATVTKDLADERAEITKKLSAFTLPPAPVSPTAAAVPVVTGATTGMTGPPTVDLGRLAELQSLITQHLTLVNKIPGATLPDTDTGGKGESKYRRVLLEHLGLLHFAGAAVPHSQSEMQDAVLGLLDVKSLAKKELAGGYLTVTGKTANAVNQLVQSHFSQIEAAYPGALAAAKLSSSGSVDRIAKALMKSGTIPRGAPPAAGKKGATTTASTSGSPTLMDDSVFGAHQSLPEGIRSPGLPNLFPRQFQPPDPAGAQLAGQWADAQGDLKADKVPRFVAAYIQDTRQAGVYLAEGEGPTVAAQFGITLKVYRDRFPDGFVRVENVGGGDCLIHAVKDAAAARHLGLGGVKPADIPGRLGPKGARAATGDEIAAVRKTIAARLEHVDVAEDTAVAAAAIFRDAVDGRATPGLGPNMLKLLADPQVAHAISWTAAKIRFAEERQRIEDEKQAKKVPKAATDASKATTTPPSSTPPSKAPPSSSKAGADRPPPSAVAQDTYGKGPVEQHLALLHTGGNHYVALVRIADGPGK